MHIKRLFLFSGKAAYPKIFDSYGGLPSSFIMKTLTVPNLFILLQSECLLPKK